MRNNLDDAELFNPIIAVGLKLRTMTKVLAGAFSIPADAPPLINLDPDGSTRVITLPTEEEGLMFLINNWAGGAEDLTINNPAAGTIGTISQNEAGLALCAGGIWYLRLVGTTT